MKSKQRRKVKKKVFLVHSPGNPVNFTCESRKTSLKQHGFKYCEELLLLSQAPKINPEVGQQLESIITKKKFLITTEYNYIKCTKRCPKLLGQKTGVQACSTGGFLGLTWIDNFPKREIFYGEELNRQLGFFAGSSSTNVLPPSNYDSRPRSTLSQDQLHEGLSPVVCNIKIHPGIYPPRQEKPVCEEQEATRKEAKVKPRPTVIEQHCQEPITKQIKKLLLQKTKTQRRRKSQTWQETKENLGKEGRTLTSEIPQVRKKKQSPCFTVVVVSSFLLLHILSRGS